MHGFKGKDSADHKRIIDGDCRMKVNDALTALASLLLL